MPRNNKIDAPQPDKPGSTEVVILLQADTGPALAEGEIMAGETIKLELEEEKRKAALAVASLAEERRRLAVTQAALEEERRRTEAAKAALEAEKLKTLEAFQALEANNARTGKTDVAEKAAEAAGTADSLFGLNPLVGFNSTDIISGTQEYFQEAMKQPMVAFKHYYDYLREITQAFTGQSALEPEAGDKRFADPAWKDNPFYKTYLQSYLAWNKTLHAFINDSKLKPKETERARFAISLLTDALAPTNNLFGNPAAMKKFFETGGASAARGFSHLVEDLAKNGGMPSQVDMKAFKVGENLALTPGSVVFQNEMLELIQYAPATAEVYERPLLLIPPQINKFYVLDLAPGKSLIEYLVKQGLTTFILSWRNPTTAHRNWGLETYVKAIIEATEAVREITGSEDINILGTCSGGMTLAALLGHLAAKGDERINATSFFVTVLDFSVESQIGLLTRKETVEAAKKISRLKGVLEGQELARVFAWLRPNDLVWNYWVNNYLIGNDPPVFDILYWNNDTTRLPAQFHGELVDMSQTNPFTQPGALKVLGTPIDLSKVKCDSYVLGGTTDHITPWQACYATTQLLGGQSQFVLSSSGHIQSILNPPNNPKAKFYTASSYPANPEQWLAGAQPQTGSWWEHWRTWLWERSGELKPATRSLGSARYKPGVKAPGTYIFEP